MSRYVIEDILTHVCIDTSDTSAKREEVWVSRVLSNITSWRSDYDYTLNLPLDLSHLYQIRSNPFLCIDNLRMDNIHHAVEELKSVPSCIMLDSTPIDEGRDLHGLLSIATSLSTHKILFCTSPHLIEADLDLIKRQGVDENSAAYGTMLQRLSEEMKVELVVGISMLNPSSTISSEPLTPKYRKAIGISCNLGKAWCSSASLITELQAVDKVKLKACCRTQQLFHQTNPNSIPPLIIYLPLLCDKGFIQEVAQVLNNSRVCWGHVVFSQVNFGMTSLDFLTELLSQFNIILSFDTFGYKNILVDHLLDRSSRIVSEAELLCVIQHLVNKGFGDRIIVSSNFQMKLQLKSFGGYGLEILNQLNIQPLSGSEKCLGKLSTANLIRVLTWRVATEAIAIEPDKISCHICRQLFIPGDHYSKFGFDYCSKRCLLAHRDKDWK